MKYIKSTVAVVLSVVMCMSLTAGCVKREKNKISEPVTTELQTDGKEDVRYNTQDTVILTGIDSEKKQISVKSTGSSGKAYVLNYNNGTSIKNKYGSEVLIDRLEPGEIIDVYYVAGTQKLISMEENSESWENDSVTVWDMDYEKSIMSIGGVNYKYDGGTYILSGKKTIDIRSISGVDTLTVRGKDKEIYSIVVKTGHGYIKLTDTKNMVGGIVEVGNKIMTVITEDMVIAAPEGEHVLTASKDGKGGTAKVTVVKDSDVIVSLSGFQGEIKKNGALKLNIQPENAQYNVFVDGKEVDGDDIIDLSYGVHKLRITSDKYSDYVESITIGSIYMNKTVNMDAVSETESSENGTEKDTDKNSGTASAGNNLVTINKPEGASLYLDGVFKGIIPLTIKKQSGSHSVILRQTGYTSVTYNVEFSDDTSDVSISFPAMEK